jgi:hypothetical protein
MTPTENAEQAALFQWADFAALTYPELVMMYAIPNGGLRDARTAVTLQRTGVKSGVPDICLPVARGGYNGLYIEMKRQKGGVLSANQKIWIDRLRAHGNKAVVCKGWEAARDAITDYLDGK